MGIGALASISVAIVSGILWLWFSLQQPPQVAPLIGDAAAPFVGIITAGALIAALWSVRLQNYSILVQLRELQRQREELVESRREMQAQTQEQAKLTRLQHKQLQAEEHRELRAAYAAWLQAANEWLADTMTSGHAMAHLGQAACLEDSGSQENAAHRTMSRSMWSVVLLESNSQRAHLVRQLSAPIGLGNIELGTEDGYQRAGRHFAEQALERLGRLEALSDHLQAWFVGAKDPVAEAKGQENGALDQL